MNNTKKALITGLTGQDGSYLAEFLIKKGYEVHGIKRRSSSINTNRIDHIYDDSKYKDSFFIHYGDLTDSLALNNLIANEKPDEIYNLAAQSHVAVSFEVPEYTANVDALGTLRILESVRQNNLINHTRIYQASTSELYGKVQEIPQNEETPFYPRSPYAVAKLYGYWITKNYREAYDMFAVNGILFNHESPRRGETFVTRKITRGITSIFKGHAQDLVMGNLSSLRDWGHAKDYVEMQWLMLQQEKPVDMVISTGKQYSVREFITWSCDYLGIGIEFSGDGVDEIGTVTEVKNPNCKAQVGQVIVRVNKKYYRPTEVDTLLGDSSLAKQILGWEPKISAKEMCHEMIDHDLRSLDLENSHNY